MFLITYKVTKGSQLPHKNQSVTNYCRTEYIIVAQF